MELKIVRAVDLNKYMMKEKVYLLDIRSRSEYLKYHIDGAIHVSEERMEDFLKVKGKDALFILCCERGISSIKVGKRFANQGYRMGTLAGGVTAYKKSH